MGVLNAPSLNTHHVTRLTDSLKTICCIVIRVATDVGLAEIGGTVRLGSGSSGEEDMLLDP
jgi:hypothetical protein